MVFSIAPNGFADNVVVIGLFREWGDIKLFGGRNGAVTEKFFGGFEADIRRRFRPGGRLPTLKIRLCSSLIFEWLFGIICFS